MLVWITDTRRNDGLTIQKAGVDKWTIHNGSETITLCPCCDRPMKTLRAAKLVADAVFPNPREALK
jgi:hypothetical protein